MCGRFVGFRSLEELKNFFPIDEAVCEVMANYNVAPSQEILIIVRKEGKNWLDKFHWGLVPFWADDPSIGNKMINARAESVATKPSFKHALKKRRCLIPANGFFEWKGKKGQRQPVFITHPDGNPFAFAGLWETWNRKDDTGFIYKSCSIITTESSESVRIIHHRMPVILKPEAYGAWLDPEFQDMQRLENILKDDIVTELISNPVSKRVNTVHNNDASNIEAIILENKTLGNRKKED